MAAAASAEKLLKDAQDYDLLITSYDYLKRDPDLYHEMRFRYGHPG